MRKTSILLLILLLLLPFMYGGCSGNSGRTDPLVPKGSGWITIENPTQGESYTLLTEEITLIRIDGSVFGSPYGKIPDQACDCIGWECLARYPDINCWTVYWPRVDVTVTNLTTDQTTNGHIYYQDRLNPYENPQKWYGDVSLVTGENRIIATADDGMGNSAGDLIVITAPDWQPVANDDQFTAYTTLPAIIEPLLNDLHPAMSEVAIVSVTQGDFGTVEIVGGISIRYTPNGTGIGQDEFTYTIRDYNGSESSAYVTGNILLNTPPVAVADELSTPEDVAVDFDVLENDIDQEGDALTMINIGVPNSGSISLNIDGTIHYVPMPDMFGTDSFTYEISDGKGATDLGMVIVTILPVNDPPQSTDDLFSALANTNSTIPVLANDTDIDNVTLSIVEVDIPQYGVATISPAGEAILYTPNPGFRGKDQFLYKAQDTGGLSDTALVTVGVGLEFRRVDIDSDGTEGNGHSSRPAISGDGRHIVFESYLSDLGGSNGEHDILVHDRDADENGIFDEPGGFATRRINNAYDGTDANDDSFNPEISDDGNVIAYNSYAGNLISTEFPDRGRRVYVYERDADSDGILDEDPLLDPGSVRTHYISDAGGFDVTLSADGRYVGFSHYSIAGSRELVLFDRGLEQLEVVATFGSPGGSSSMRVTPDGRFAVYVAYQPESLPDSSSYTYSAFVYDLETNVLESIADWQDIYARNITPDISDNGQYIVYSTNYDSDYHNIYIHDRENNQSVCITCTGYDGYPTNRNHARPSISGDGRFVAFPSGAPNMVPNDTNGQSGIFVYDRLNEKIVRVSVDQYGRQLNWNGAYAPRPRISANGLYITFEKFLGVYGVYGIYVVRNLLLP